MDAAQSVASIRGVNHAFGEKENRKQVLFDVNLDLQPGEIVIMTGPSVEVCSGTAFLDLDGA